MPKFDDVKVGEQLPSQQVTVDQAQLIQYAGASGDFNPLHWQQEFAEEVSPTGGVIAHGMFSTGHAARVVAEWAGGPEKVLRVGASFRKPWPVGETATFGGEVVELDAAARTATVEIWCELETGGAVIDRRSSQAVVQLD